MRACCLWILIAVGVTLAVVASPGTPAAARPSARPMPAAQGKGGFAPARIARTIYSQLDNDNGVSIVSQHFETRFLPFDSQGADDFKIAGKAVVKQVSVDGVYFEGNGPANSIHVTIYKDAAGAPGAIVRDIPHAPFIDVSGKGSFLVTVPKFTLKKGTYWLSVFVNMPFRLRGDWGWSTNNTVRHAASKWRNPLDGFDTGCTSWTRTIDCILAGEGGDFSFALRGTGH